MRKLKILVTEDESLIRLGLKSMLTALGHEVLLAVDGHEALNQFHARSPDLAILNIRMPFTDGLKAAKAMYRHRPVPILLLTPRPDGEVGLILRDDILFGVGILDGQVTGVTRKENCPDQAFRTATDGYHFGDVNEMILDVTSAVKAGKLGLLDYRFEITVISEAKHSDQSASRQNARIAGGHLWANKNIVV